MQWKHLVIFFSLLLFVVGCSDNDETESVSSEASEPFKLGLILVGPRDYNGWSQAHFEGASHAIEIVGG